MAPLMVSPAVGGLFETLVFSEIVKSAAFSGKSWDITYLRNKEKDELDFLVLGDNQKRVALEVKWSRHEAEGWNLPRRFHSIVEDAPIAVVSPLGGPSRQAGVTHLSLAELSPYLRAHL